MKKEHLADGRKREKGIIQEEKMEGRNRWRRQFALASLALLPLFTCSPENVDYEILKLTGLKIEVSRRWWYLTKRNSFLKLLSLFYFIEIKGFEIFNILCTKTDLNLKFELTVFSKLN